MNYIKAEISAIDSIGTINLVHFKVQTEVMKMISLELDQSLKVGTHVHLGAKATNIAIAKTFSGELSISNQLSSVITSLQMGELLCSVKFDFLGTSLESIITKDSAMKMNLKEGDAITALIKSSELSIVEVL